jgi:hypothetical protein
VRKLVHEGVGSGCMYFLGCWEVEEAVLYGVFQFMGSSKIAKRVWHGVKGFKFQGGLE